MFHNPRAPYSTSNTFTNFTPNLYTRPYILSHVVPTFFASDLPEGYLTALATGEERTAPHPVYDNTDLHDFRTMHNNQDDARRRAELAPGRSLDMYICIHVRDKGIYSRGI